MLSAGEQSCETTRDTADDAIPGIDVRTLPAGTELVVRTCNSCYRVVMMLDGATAWVEGGRYFSRGAEVRIAGSTGGGSLLKIGWICPGLFLELSVRGKPIRTSLVRSIDVEPVVVAEQ